MARSAALLLALLIVSPAFAGDDPKTHQAKVAIKVFTKEWKSESEGVRMQALWDLAHVRHELCVEVIGRVVLTDPDHQVRIAGASVLAKAKGAPRIAGSRLRGLLKENDDHPAVLVQFIRAIGDLGYIDARDELIDTAGRFMEEKYKHVTIEVMRTFGKLRDVQALPFLLKLAEFQGESIRGRRGPEIRTGSSMPMATRRWKWMRKYGKHAFPKGNPLEIVRWYMDALESAAEKISGEEFDDTEAFRTWLEENARRLDVPKRELDPKKRKPLRPKSPKTVKSSKKKS